MQFNSKALVTLTICLAVMMLVLTTRQSSVDLIVNVAGWGLVAAMSVVAVWKMARGRRLTSYSQADSMPERIRRWVLGETTEDRRQSGGSEKPRHE